MTKDFDIIDMNDKKTGKFAEAMGNKTSKKIFNYLKKKKGCITDIAKDLNLPVSTAHYSVKKLHDAGLIKIHDYYWSPKGNKVQIYTVAERALVFTPNKTPYMEAYLKSALSVMVLVVIAGFFVAFPPTNPVAYSEGEYLNFNSDSELVKAFEEARQGMQTNSGGFGGVMKLFDANFRPIT